MGSNERAECKPWNESYFDAQRENPSIYWVRFWTGDDVEEAAQHDPQQITDADSVVEVLEWVNEVKGDRRYELFVETTDRAEMRAHGWTNHRKLIRLAGDFTPAGTEVTITAYAQE